MRVVDAVSNVVQLSGRFRKPPEGMESTAPSEGLGALGQLEARLAGVVVAALKEAFDRDRARMDLERAHLESERLRAEEALRAELRRQAAERALGQVRLVAMMAIAVWMLSAALGVWLPGMRVGAPRMVLGVGWACTIAALGCAFSAWQRISVWGATDSAGNAAIGPGIAERTAPWLLLGAIALSGTALLLAL